MAQIIALAKGPLTPCEQAVLDAIPLAKDTHVALADAAGISEHQLADALAQLTRRGLIHRTAPKRRHAHPLHAPRRARPNPQPNPTPPAA